MDAIVDRAVEEFRARALHNVSTELRSPEFVVVDAQRAVIVAVEEVINHQNAQTFLLEYMSEGCQPSPIDGWPCASWSELAMALVITGSFDGSNDLCERVRGAILDYSSEVERRRELLRV